MSEFLLVSIVATAPTVYGIETYKYFFHFEFLSSLQQHLPFTVLKPGNVRVKVIDFSSSVATAPTVYGIETSRTKKELTVHFTSCNSTYRLRY